MSSVTEQIIERLKELRDQIRYYGLIMGGTLIGIELMAYFVQTHISVLNSILFFFIKITALFLVSRYIIKKIKPEFFKKGMSYSQSFSLIFRLFLYGSLFVGIYSFALNQWVNPEHQTEVINNVTTYFQSYVENAGIPDAQLEMFEERFDEMKEQAILTPLQAMWNSIWSYITWGLFVGLTLSIFTRDKDLTPFSEDINTKQ